MKLVEPTKEPVADAFVITDWDCPNCGAANWAEGDATGCKEECDECEEEFVLV
jgi:hypothetical protein